MNSNPNLAGPVRNLFASKIGKRIILLTVLTSGVITLTATLLQMTFEYNSQFNEVETRHHEVEHIHVPQIAISLWNFDNTLLQQRLDGLVELPTITYLAIESETDSFSSGERASTLKVSNQFPIYYQPSEREPEYLGTLFVESDTSGIYKELMSYFVTTLLINGIKTFIVCFAILFTVSRIINHRIFSIYNYLAEFNPDQNHAPLELPYPNHPMTRGDEVEKLGAQVNQLTLHISNLYRSLSYEHKRFSEFATISSDWLWETNAQDELIYASDKMEESLSLPELPVPLEQIPLFNQSNELLVQLKSRSAHIQAEERMPQQGAPHYLLFHATPRLEEGEFSGFRGTALDITELIEAQLRLKELNQSLEEKVEKRTHDLHQSLDQLKQAQDQLIESEKLSALGSLVAGIAHEVNTPLGVAITSASILRELIDSLKSAYSQHTLTRTQLDEYIHNTREAMHLLEANLKRGEELIRSFKQTAADQVSENCHTFNLHQVLSDLMASLHPETRKKSAQLTLSGDKGLTMLSYPGVLTQIVSNLIMNSLIHAFSHQPSPKITIEFKLEDEHVVITYQDNGCGIPEELQQKVFDPFYTTNRKNGGTGLGLTLIYNLITKKLQGHLELSSTREQGVQFTLTMPQKLLAENIIK